MSHLSEPENGGNVQSEGQSPINRLKAENTSSEEDEVVSSPEPRPEGVAEGQDGSSTERPVDTAAEPVGQQESSEDQDIRSAASRAKETLKGLSQMVDRDREMRDRERRPKLAEFRISQDELDETLKRYEPTGSLDKIDACLTQQQIVIIAGPEASGKHYTAKYLAAKCKHEDIRIEVFDIPDDFDDRHFLIVNRPEHSFFVVGDAFSSQESILIRLMGGEDCADIGRLRYCLGSACYLVATISDKRLAQLEQKLLRNLRDRSVLILDYQFPNPCLVLKRYMRVFLGETRAQNLFEELGDNLDVYARELGTPHKIAKFVEYDILTWLGEDSVEEDIRAKIEQAVKWWGSFDREIAVYFEMLTEQEKLMAFSLSLLGQWPELGRWPESGFWRMHRRLQPAISDPVNVKAKKKIKKKPQLFDIPKSQSLNRIRARVATVPVLVGDQEHPVRYIEFADERYAQAIHAYVKTEYPEFLEKTISRLVDLAREHENDRDRTMRIAATSALGLVSRADWPRVRGFVFECAHHDYAHIRAMAGHVLHMAFQDPETRLYVMEILDRWSKEGDFRERWTAASAFKEIGRSDLDFALDGLEDIAHGLDLSPLETILSFAARVETLDEDADIMDVLQLTFDYVFQVQEADERWSEVEPVYDSLAYAIVVLALNRNLKEAIETLCDWVNDSKSTNGYSPSLAAGLIWLYLAETYADISRREKTRNEILELIGQDKEALDALAELLSGSFVRLHRIHLEVKRMSFRVFEILDNWAETSKDPEVLTSLLQATRAYLRNHPVILQYVDRLIKRRWLAKRAPEQIQSLAKSIFS